MRAARRRARRGQSRGGKAGSERASLTAASRRHTHSPLSHLRLRGPASPRATRRARHVPVSPGPRAPGKLSHTCALRPAPAACARQRGKREKGPGPQSLPLRTKWGGAFLVGTRSGPGQGRVWGKDSSGRRAAGRVTATFGQGGGPESGPGKSVGLPAAGAGPRGWGWGDRWEGAEPTPPLLCLGSEVSGSSSLGRSDLLPLPLNSGLRNCVSFWGGGASWAGASASLGDCSLAAC